MSNPHDALFKAVFGDPANAASYVRNVLPPAVIDRLALDEMELQRGSFVDDELRNRHADLLFQVPMRDEDKTTSHDEAEQPRPREESAREQQALLYILFEHQSTSDPLMPLRLLRYMVRIWDQLLDEANRRRTLPPVVPLVLHHSDTGWTAPIAFSELLEIPPGLQEQLGPYLPQFRFLLTDLSRTPDRALRGTAIAQVTYLLFKHVKAGDFLDKLTSWNDLLDAVAREHSGLRALHRVIEYIYRASTADFTVHDLVAAIQPAHSNMQEKLTTLADRLRKEGFEQGIERGLEQGIERGRLSEQARSVVRTLAARGLAVSPEAEQRILSCTDSAQLERWLDVAFRVTATAQLFDDE